MSLDDYIVHRNVRSDQSAIPEIQREIRVFEEGHPKKQVVVSNIVCKDEEMNHSAPSRKEHPRLRFPFKFL